MLASDKFIIIYPSSPGFDVGRGLTGDRYGPEPEHVPDRGIGVELSSFDRSIDLGARPGVQQFVVDRSTDEEGNMGVRWQREVHHVASSVDRVGDRCVALRCAGQPANQSIG